MSPLALAPVDENADHVRGSPGGPLILEYGDYECPYSRQVSLHPCDLGDPTACARLAELAVNEFGRIDVLYDLAARSYFSWLEGFTDEAWDAARRDEVDLVFYLTRAAWPHLQASRGVVEEVASVALFFASDESSYVTGIDLVVDGGMKVW